MARSRTHSLSGASQGGDRELAHPLSNWDYWSGDSVVNRCRQHMISIRHVTSCWLHSMILRCIELYVGGKKASFSNYYFPASNSCDRN